MRIFDEPMDQCLLCVGYDFNQDAPIFRDVALGRFQPGVSQKEWWRYQHNHLGLRTLVAYDGPRPIGHVEFIPIQYSPRPATGSRMLFIDCLFVDKSARSSGVGSALLTAAEQEAKSQGKGIALLGRESGPFMPAAFFEKRGYTSGEARDGERLLYKTSFTSEPPRFLPVTYQPRTAPTGIAVDFFHCPQCPLSGNVLLELRDHLASRPERVDLHVINTGQRATIEQLGVAQGVYVDGRRLPDSPPPYSDHLKRALEAVFGQ